MKTFHSGIQRLSLANLCLLTLTVTILSLNLNLIGKAGLTNLQVTTILYTGAIAFRFKNNSHAFNLESGLVERLLAIGLVALIFLNSTILPNYDLLIRCLPFISAFSLALLVSGIKDIKQYWQELMFFLLLAVPLERLVEPINQLTNVNVLMTKFSTFILWYVGFDVASQGDVIITPQINVWIGPNCVGVVTIMWMLQLALLFLVTYPTKFWQKFLVPIVSVTIVWLFNGILRIPLLVLFAAYNYPLYEYWHSDDAQIFSTIPIMLLWGFCYWLTQQNQRENYPQELS